MWTADALLNAFLDTLCREEGWHEDRPETDEMRVMDNAFRGSLLVTFALRGEEIRSLFIAKFREKLGADAFGEVGSDGWRKTLARVAFVTGMMRRAPGEEVPREVAERFWTTLDPFAVETYAQVAEAVCMAAMPYYSEAMALRHAAAVSARDGTADDFGGAADSGMSREAYEAHAAKVRMETGRLGFILAKRASFPMFTHDECNALWLGLSDEEREGWAEEASLVCLSNTLTGA